MTLPINPTQQAEVGDDFLAYIDTGITGTPAWVLLGGQRDTTLNRSKEVIDVSSKTSGGYKSVRPGQKTWGLDLSALILLEDEGALALEEAYNTDVDVHIKFEFPNASYVEGWGVLTEYPIEAPSNGEASLKGTIEGNGPLSALTTGV